MIIEETLQEFRTFLHDIQLVKKATIIKIQILVTMKAWVCILIIYN